MNITRLLPLVAISCFLLCTGALGQASQSNQPPDTSSTASANADTGPRANGDPNAERTGGFEWAYLTSHEFVLASAVLLFGVIVMFGAARTMQRTTVTAEQVLRFYAILVILIGTLLLIVAGLNDTQIAPAAGLFGTIAGYLLGKNQSDANGLDAEKHGDDKDEETK